MDTHFPASGAISTYKSMDQLQYVLTRKALSGISDIFPLESERLTLKEGIQAVTLNGAHIIGLEGEIGSIEKGKKADLIILDQNLFGIDVSQIHKTKTLMTMMDGKIVYEAPASRQKMFTITQLSVKRRISTCCSHFFNSGFRHPCRSLYKDN